MAFCPTRHQTPPNNSKHLIRVGFAIVLAAAVAAQVTGSRLIALEQVSPRRPSAQRAPELLQQPRHGPPQYYDNPAGNRVHDDDRSAGNVPLRCPNMSVIATSLLKAKKI